MSQSRIYVQTPEGKEGMVLLTARSFQQAIELGRVVSVLENELVKSYLATSLKIVRTT